MAFDPAVPIGSGLNPINHSDLVTAGACDEGVAAYDAAVTAGVSDIPGGCKTTYPSFYVWCWEKGFIGFGDATFLLEDGVTTVHLSGGVKSYTPVPDSVGIPGGMTPTFDTFDGTKNHRTPPVLRSYDPADLI